MFGVFWGLYFSKMAKKGTRSFWDTFYMILGTSKISLNLGPIIGHFWARRPCISGFPYTKLLQKILESIWEPLGKILFSIYDNQNFRKLSKRQTLTFLNLFLNIIFWILFCIYC